MDRPRFAFNRIFNTALNDAISSGKRTRNKENIEHRRDEIQEQSLVNGFIDKAPIPRSPLLISTKKECGNPPKKEFKILHDRQPFKEDDVLLDILNTPASSSKTSSRGSSSNSLSSGYIPAPSPVSFESLETPKYEYSSEKESSISADVDTNTLTESMLRIEKEELISTNDIPKRILRELHNIIKKRFQGATVTLYGSYSCGLAVFSSNINIGLETKDSVANDYLLKIHNCISEGLNYGILPFKKRVVATRSVIRFIEPYSCTPCDLIPLSEDVEMCLRTSSLLKDISEREQRIKSLFISARIWAEVSKLGGHDQSDGQLPYVAFSIMVIHFLQQLKKPVLPLIDVSSAKWGLELYNSSNNSNLGELWLQFLHYYCNFNWKDHVVSIVAKHTVLKSSTSWKNSLMVIEDPFTKKNISAGIILYEERQFIKSCFHKLLTYFQSPEAEYAKIDTSAASTAFTSAQKLRQNSFSCFALREFSTTKSHLIPEHLNKIEGVLREIYSEYALSTEEILERKTFVENLEKYIQERLPGAKLVMIGSGVNGFGLKNSDVDISMCVSDETEDEQALLKETKYHLMRNEKYDNILVLGKAVTPIIKFLYKPLNYQVDICINNFSAVHNSHLLRTYCKYDERCKLLGCALKVLAKKNDICSAAKQTLSSYSYILMVINYLQQVKPPVLPRFEIHDENVFQDNLKVPFKTLVKNKWMYEDSQTLRKLHSLKDNSTPLPELWLGLLKYYSSKTENVISIKTERMEMADLPKKAALYNIDDPFIKKNLGCSLGGHNVPKVLSVLNRAIYLLQNEVPDYVKDLKDYYFCLK